MMDVLIPAAFMIAAFGAGFLYGRRVGGDYWFDKSIEYLTRAQIAEADCKVLRRMVGAQETRPK